MEPLIFRKHQLRDRSGDFTVSTAFLAHDQCTLGGNGACTVAALYLTEALHYSQSQVGLLPSSEHYAQLWQLAIHKWNSVQNAVFSPSTTYGQEFPDGYFPVKDAIKGTGLPVKEVLSETAVSVDLGPSSAPLKAWGLTTTICNLLRELVSGNGRGPKKSEGYRQFIVVHRQHTFLLSSKISCRCGTGHAGPRCTSTVYITDSLGSTLVENGQHGYIMQFLGGADTTDCALDAALRALMWRFEVHYDVGGLLDGSAGLETLYQGLAVELSEVVCDATVLPRAAFEATTMPGQGGKPVEQAPSFSPSRTKHAVPYDGMSTPSRATLPPAVKEATPRKTPLGPSASNANAATRSLIRASPRQAARERSKLFSTWTTVGGGSRLSTRSPRKPPSGCTLGPLVYNSFDALLTFEVGDEDRVFSTSASAPRNLAQHVFVQNLSNRNIIFQLPILPTESISSFIERVATRFELPQAAGRPVEIRLKSQSLESASLEASFESTSVRPGDKIVFEAYLECCRKKHFQPLSLFPELKGGRIAKACIECDRSGKSGEVRKGGHERVNESVKDGFEVPPVANEQWCASCRSFKPKSDFAGGRKSCQVCQIRTAKKNKERGEMRAAKRLASKAGDTGPLEKELPTTSSHVGGPQVDSATESTPAQGQAGKAEPRKLDTPVEAWVSAEETSGGIDLLLRRDEPSKLVDKGLPSFRASDPSTWVSKKSVRSGSIATLRYREFKCMCYGKSKAKSALERSPSRFNEGRGSAEMSGQKVENETAQDRFLRQAKEDENRGRRKARKGLEIKFSNKLNCKYRFTATTRAEESNGVAGTITVKIYNEHLESCREAHSYRGLDKQLRVWIKMLLDLGCSPAEIIDYINTPSTLPHGIPNPPGPSAQGNGPERAHSQRWSPQEKDIENMLQSIRRGKYLDPNDQKATYEFLKRHCKEAAESRARDQPSTASQDPLEEFDVIKYQEFECHCHDDSPKQDINTQASSRVGKERIKNKVRKQKCEHSSQCKPFIAVLQSSWQRRVLGELHEKRLADVVCLDATGQTNQYRWPLSALVVPDEQGHAIPVAFMISSTEREEPLEVFFEAVQEACPKTFKPRAFSIDMSDVEINAIRKVFGNTVDVRICFFHVMQAWERWLKRSANRVSEQQRIAILRMIRQMKLAPDLERWQKAHNLLVAYLTSEDLEQVLVHLRRDWIGSETRPIYKMWCNAFRTKRIRSWYRIETNNLVERFFKTLKWRFLEGKNNKRLERVLEVLTVEVRNFYLTRREHTLAGRNANWKLYETVLDKERKALLIHDTPGAIKVLDGQSGHAQVASKAALQVLAMQSATVSQAATSSPTSSARYYTVVLRGGFCDCDEQSGLLCKHVRSVARKLGGLEKWNLKLESLREEVLMEVKTAEMEQQTSLSNNRPDRDVDGVNSDVEEEHEKSLVENEVMIALRKEVHGALDKICEVEPWTNAKQLLKEVLIRVNADLRQEERTLKPKSFTRSKKTGKGKMKRKRSVSEAAKSSEVNPSQDIGTWVGRHVGSRPKRAKQADHPRQAEDDVELSRIAAELDAKKIAAESKAPAAPVRSKQESLARYKEKRRRAKAK